MPVLVASQGHTGPSKLGRRLILSSSARPKSIGPALFRILKLLLLVTSRPRLSSATKAPCDGEVPWRAIMMGGPPETPAPDPRRYVLYRDADLTGKIDLPDHLRYDVILH